MPARVFPRNIPPDAFSSSHPASRVPATALLPISATFLTIVILMIFVPILMVLYRRLKTKPVS